MSTNPLFPQDESKDGKTEDPAVELIRSKVERAYAAEPSASEELAEVKNERSPSKHQQYMLELSASGKSLAEIQTAWHHYYTTLSDVEKHEVWQEFYAANQHTPYQKLFQKQQAIASRKHEEAAPAESSAAAQPAANEKGIVVADHQPVEPKKARPGKDSAAAKKIKQQLNKKVGAKGKLTVKHHLQSLAFGLASGVIVLVVLLFGFFNEYFIAPFIQPSRNVSATPIILGDTTANANLPPSVTIPKINVQIPLNFNVATVDEAAVENGLKTGVVHYANTVMPGQNGNAAYFGHSAVNVFNNGVKYKFAFTLLHNLTTGDIFYITYGGKNYAYRVFAREIVPPSQVSVISDTKGKQATATLITCDPPGVSTNRLVVWGEQISPAITTNTTPTTTPTTDTTPDSLASNGPTAWSSFIHTLEFWK